jgi:thiol:disulfide interchange protein DsbD
MLVYSAAFALPFFLLAAAPGLVSHLPRAGEWMHTLRVLIGLLEIGAAIKFLSNADLVLRWGVFTRNVVLIGWCALALAGAAYLGRNLPRKMRQRELDPVRLGAVAVVLLIAFWLASGIGGRTLPAVEAFLPPAAPTSVTAASGEAPVWVLNDYAAAQSAARSSGKLVFVDFTGYTCTNCRWMEANIFNRPDVSTELSQFVLSRLYTDGDGEIYERQQAFQEKTFGTVALPLYAVVDADGKVRATFSGLTRNAADFIAFLRRARA